MKRAIYNYEQALNLHDNGEDIYIDVEGKLELADKEDLELAHPHDNFYSKPLDSKEESLAIAQGHRVTP